MWESVATGLSRLRQTTGAAAHRDRNGYDNKQSSFRVLAGSRGDDWRMEEGCVVVHSRHADSKPPRRHQIRS